MGSKCSIISFALDLPRRSGFDSAWSPDLAASRILAERLTGCSVERAHADTCTLDAALWPNPGTVAAGSAGSLDLVTWSGLSETHPSTLTPLVHSVDVNRSAYLVLMDSTVDWAAFACWSGGALLRSVSISFDDGVIEAVGEPLAFEHDFWGGPRRRVPQDYPFPFAISAIGNAALREFFGFVLEGKWDPQAPDPEEIPIHRFRLPGATKVEASMRMRAEAMLRRRQ
ncbi:DUF6928 family protein [Micromonospora sp. NPDC000442]|uniref:DUF6928 family protein n=1 Tax=Micromonospora sp. NPDC000442 TaxID=3364217 RepID=UPI0036AE349E